VSRVLTAIRRRSSLALLPLSVLPFVALAPTIVHSHQRFQRAHDMGPLPAPVVGMSAAESARFTPLPSSAGTVPVLVWHGIDEARDGYSTSRRAFARQLTLLKRLGYTAISTRQWADFRAGRGAGLPAKPILLTFDDGRLDSYRGADRILEREGMRAAMFVITGQIDRRSPFYLTWAELHRMADSGRWDIEPHAHQGHGQITVAPDGRQAGFYAARRYTRSQGRETLAAWEARVSSDLFTLRDRFAAQGFRPHAFAVPYGDYGQRAANDPAIPRLLTALLTRQFGSFLVQADDDDPGFTAPGTGAAERYELRTGTTLDQLYGWLRRHAMRAARHHHPKKKR
jgi:peptidoglycan/xylan/chitin deacetylase (PgdA/CDA1 family)